MIEREHWTIYWKKEFISTSYRQLNERSDVRMRETCRTQAKWSVPPFSPRDFKMVLSASTIVSLSYFQFQFQFQFQFRSDATAWELARALGFLVYRDTETSRLFFSIFTYPIWKFSHRLIRQTEDCQQVSIITFTVNIKDFEINLKNFSKFENPNFGFRIF